MVDPAAATWFDGVLDAILLPMWLEICCIVCFIIGWHFSGKVKPVAKAAKKIEPTAKRLEQQTAQADVHLRLQELVESESFEAAAALWRQAQAEVHFSPAALRLVVRALSATHPENMPREIAQHLRSYNGHCNSKAALAVLEELSCSPCMTPEHLEHMYRELQMHAWIRPSRQVYEVLLGSYAAAGDELRVHVLIDEITADKGHLTAKAHALILRGFLQQGLLDASLAQAQAMMRQGFYVPTYSVPRFLHVASQADRLEEVFSIVLDKMELPAEAIVLIFEDCLKRSDAELARRVEKFARSVNGGALPPAAYSALLKLNIFAGDVHAQELFAEMQQARVYISGQLCISCIFRCAESKFLCFAQEVADYLRAGDGMTLAAYAGLIRTYSACDLHSLACDLQVEIQEQGLQPDADLHSDLMKCAVKAGRSDRARDLFDAMPKDDARMYMLLIQSAGRDKDADRAFDVFERLKSSVLTVDRAVYNCLLDACVCAGDMRRARLLVVEMRGLGLLDVIGCNTLLKGFAALGDAKGCQECFNDIAAHDLKPNQISYNCLVHAAASAGDFELAWGTVDSMEAAGFKGDRYTTSIMLQALKYKHTRPGDVHRALSLLDRLDCILGSDGVLLSSAIETCIRFRIWHRLQSLIELWEKSSLRPCVRTYATLVRAYGAVHNVDRCLELWQQVVRERGTEANDIVLGCVLNALVSNGAVTEAVSVFRKAQEHNIHPNMVCYSTLIKGFAAQSRVEEAMDMWREIRASCVQPNTLVYNVLIDVQARTGSIDEMHQLLEGMEEDGVPQDSITFCTVMKGYCTNGCLDKGIKLLHSLQEKGLVKDCVVYNTVLTSCIQHHRLDLAEEIAMEMQQFNVAPSHFTFGILIKMYGRRYEIDKAFAVVEEMKAKYDLLPNMQVSTCLISACIYNHDLDRGLQLFEELKLTGVDIITIEVVIAGLCRACRAAEAVQVVREAYGLGYGKRLLASRQHLSERCFLRLMRSLGQQGIQQRLGFPLLEQLRAVGVPLTTSVIAASLGSDAARPRAHSEEAHSEGCARAEARH